MKARLALLALPLALAACDAKSMQDFRMPWDKPEPVAAAPAPTVPAEPPKPSIPEPTGASPLDQPLQIAGETARVATGDAETHAIRDLAASGQGWSVSVKGTTARFERPGAKAASVTVRRIPYARGLEYVGTLSDRPFVVHVTGADCNGQPLTVSVKANGNNYAGCGAPGAAPGAATSAKAPKTGA